jgi:O-methyltransferase
VVITYHSGLKPIQVTSEKNKLPMRTLAKNVYWSLPWPTRKPLNLIRSAWSHVRGHRRHFEEVERRQLMRRAFTALRFNGIEGNYAEFGCHGGMTFGLAYQESRKAGYDCTLWAFDSFCGLPPQTLPEDQHPVWVQGALKTSLKRFREICKTNGIPQAKYKVIPGFYQNTLAPGGRGELEGPEKISFAYVDCDLYTSTRTVLGYLAKRLSHGSIVAFDDYFCYSQAALAGERLAACHFLQEYPGFIFAPYCQYGWHGMSFIVEQKSMWTRSQKKLADPTLKEEELLAQLGAEPGRIPSTEVAVPRNV